ncbi:Hsp33 family molecular chaperone HslO [Congregibacter litoralis]|uniref:Disulfide bond chaperones of the HSP33 family n=1 Tax=Congregibacter litoralis KT71 TaxID=314285 RepID=A4A9I8_9GAMM|nr:Hsp33 family molecular chaperone HslO [Congregibacter litoralis]EAQ97155.1 Disulfide bond chaperones of the HSP33 family [Congregibacter litoralis KT71]
MTTPTDIPAIRHADGKRRFLFEHMDLRGEIVHLDQVISDVSDIHSYPAGVSRLLGEFLVASVLLASTLKFRGSLTVQARSDREVPLIMAECSSELTVRAIARGAEGATSDSFDALLGGGQLVLTVTPERGKQYQGIVPLTGDSLASSLDSYFSQSEQLQTRLHLSSDGSRAAGLLLQQLPPQLEGNAANRQEQWDRVCMLAATLGGDELIGLGDATLLHRLYHEEVLRLFDLEPVRFRCSCSQDRTLAALATLGDQEIRNIIEEQGAVTMDCEFCNQRYQFRESDLRGLLSSGDDAPIH